MVPMLGRLQLPDLWRIGLQMCGGSLLQYVFLNGFFQ